METRIPKYPPELKPFSYRTVWNLFPFTSSLYRCVLCLQGQDSAVHLFAKCSITKQVRKNIEDVINNINQIPLPLTVLRPLIFISQQPLKNIPNRFPFS